MSVCDSPTNRVHLKPSQRSNKTGFRLVLVNGELGACLLNIGARNVLFECSPSKNNGKGAYKILVGKKFVI